jgi:hypothetical protein
MTIALLSTSKWHVRFCFCAVLDTRSASASAPLNVCALALKVPSAKVNTIREAQIFVRRRYS